MRYTRIRSERSAGIATLTLNRPDHGNAVDDAMHSELTQVFVDARRDPEVRAVVLTGAGARFCVGGDTAAERTFTTLTGLTPFEEARLIVDTLLELDKPLIAAVNGDAFGLGAILATLADVAIVANTARLGDGHVRGGLTAGNGSAAVWPAIIGVNRAKHLLLESAPIAAEDARAVGLIQRVIPADEVFDEAYALARQWADRSSFAMRSTKALLNLPLKAAADRALALGLAFEEQAMAEG